MRHLDSSGTQDSLEKLKSFRRKKNNVSVLTIPQDNFNGFGMRKNQVIFLVNSCHINTIRFFNKLIFS